MRKMNWKAGTVLQGVAMPKYFFDPAQRVGDRITIEGTTAHHLLHVLRMGIGDSATLCDGAATDYAATIETVKKSQVTFALGNPQPCITEPQVQIVLYQSLPKGDKLEIIIQKCVELGVHKIVPVMTAHCVARIKDTAKKSARYQAIAESAAGQSMRGTVPRVCEAVTFEDAVSQVGKGGLTLVAHEQEQNNMLTAALSPAKIINIWIGPEGGFAQEEIAALQNHGAITVSLGPRILRTETAAIAAVAVISQFNRSENPTG